MTSQENSVTFLKNYCSFNNKYDCYVLLAVSRKKDSPDITNSQEICFREVIKNPESIEKKYNIIRTLVDNHISNGKKHPFYIYITVNNCDARKASYELGKIISDDLYADTVYGNDRSINFKRMNDTFVSELMKNNGSTEYFMIDIDTKNTKDVEIINRILDSIISSTDKKVTRETRHGYHIITNPFNVIQIIETLDHEYENVVEVKKNGLLFLEYVKND